MKQTITALLLALTMLFSLTGCTRKDNVNNSTTGNGTTSTPNSGTNNNTGNNGSSNEGNTNNGTMNGGTNNGTDNNSSINGGSNSADSHSRSSGSDDLFGGRSYDQMLRDGRVRDSDGFLTDGENSVTEW